MWSMVHIESRKNLMARSLLEHGYGFDLIEIIKRLQDRVLAEKYPSLDEIRHKDFCLIADVLRGWNGKDIVKFLQCIVPSVSCYQG